MTLPAPLPSGPFPPAVPPAGPRGRGTLSRELVLRTTALVALATIALSLFIALAGFQILQAQLDSRLSTALSRMPRGDDDRKGPFDQSGYGLIRVDVFQSTPVVQAPDEVTMTTEIVEALLAVPESRQATSVTLPGIGSYRVLTRDTPFHTVVALPNSEVTKPLTSLMVMAGLLTLGAIALSYVGARRVVERSLRPLNRLAATATQVTTLPLESGEGIVPIRVAPGDADPSNEVGRVGLAFNQMLDHVEEALAARHRSETKVRRFVADASHELRNPLAAIRGYAELTRRADDELPPDAEHALGRIESESRRMSALVEDLLLLARLDSEPTLDLQPTDVTELVLDAVSDARAASPDHSWLLELPPEVVVARADRYQLLQVLANLLANARTHTPVGTRVTTSLRAEGGFAVVTVCDNGPGVPAEVRDQVFERFTRADASRVRRQGASSTGLGLAIVAALVGAHHGTVSLDTVPGRTAFTVRIPLA
ncbi:MAG TPA: HAMP domain-containing sensor histidine kinase [Propionicimonas sp.]|jgi:two-component system OmpR family sensor kinase|nr:HAMP domain-containing sensor histidine kinase [Propionicimonas sp.]